MVFNSIPFSIFFLVFYAVYVRLGHRGQIRLLLAASGFLYALWDWRFLGLIGISTLVDFWVAQKIADTENEARKRRFLLVSVVTNLSILGLFKYFNFFLDSARELLSWIGVSDFFWRLDLVLPVGISFYTFKTLSYTFDVYGQQMGPTRSLTNYAAFVAFFPQLMSGPIDRAASLLPQIESPRQILPEHVRIGCWLFLWGLFKKSVVADNLAALVAQEFHLVDSMSGAWFLIYAFTLQLYCDFSGYTDMSRGLAKLMGFETAINFRNPFFATNPVDFWQRWHISLSSWVQDYLYIPIAAHYLRKGTALINQYKPHLYTMALLGLWHGASMHYVIYGLYWGIAIIIFIHFRNWKKKRSRRQKKLYTQNAPGNPGGPFLWLRRIVFFHVVCLSFVLFRSTSLDEALRYYLVLFSPPPEAVVGGLSSLVQLFNPLLWQGKLALLATAIYGLPLLLMEDFQERHGDVPAIWLLAWPVRYAIFAALVFAILTAGARDSYEFIYIQF